MATVPMIVNLDTPGEDLARKTVLVKLHRGLLGNTRTVSSAGVEVDADKDSIHPSRNSPTRENAELVLMSRAS